MTLPDLNACLNAGSAALLLLGWGFIRRRRVSAHRACMAAAFAASTLFLVSYLYYHVRAGSVRFQGQGWIRPVYFALLLSHTLLAAAVPALALRVLYLALRRRFGEHRRWARWALPVWLYVSVTGVTVYWMLYRL